ERHCNAQHKTQKREHTNDRLRFKFQIRVLKLDVSQSKSQLPDLGPGSRGFHDGRSGSLHDKGSGENSGKTVTAWAGNFREAVPDRFSDRHGLAGQKGLFSSKIDLGNDQSVRRHAVAFGQHQHISAYDIVSRNALLLSVSNNKSSRTGK